MKNSRAKKLRCSVERSNWMRVILEAEEKASVAEELLVKFPSLDYSRGTGMFMP